MSPRRSSSRSAGRFVVLEGLDGAGTTSQLRRLAELLRSEGWKVLATCEPSDGPVGTLIRGALAGRVGLPGHSGPLDPATLALLFAADRTDHLAATVCPALERGEIVLCDRYVLSSVAYQGMALPPDWVRTINARALAPDLTLFFEVRPEVAAARRAARGGAPDLYEDEVAQKKVARAYRAAIRARGGRVRLEVVDGGRSMDEVTDAALAAIRRILPKRR